MPDSLSFEKAITLDDLRRHRELRQLGNGKAKLLPGAEQGVDVRLALFVSTYSGQEPRVTKNPEAFYSREIHDLIQPIVLRGRSCRNRLKR